jgi:hypothetical protein
MLTVQKLTGAVKRFQQNYIVYSRARKPQAFKPGDEWLPGGDTNYCVYESIPACLKHVFI